MSQRVEWFDAAATGVEVVRKGDRVGGDPVTAAVAVVLSADDAVVIEGTADEVRRLLSRALVRLDSIA